MDYSKINLGQLLSSENETIKRNAVSILKQLQKELSEKIEEEDTYFYCVFCNKKFIARNQLYNHYKEYHP